MKNLSRKLCVVAIAAVTIAAFTVSAIAASPNAIPDDIITENRDGRQLIVKTYTLSPDDDPVVFNEESFTQEGYRYEQIGITKENQTFSETKSHSETVTVNTEKNDLAEILGSLAPTLDYNADGFIGTLALDHTSIVTEATGYSTRSYTVTETEVIDNLDRNDMSYVPSTMVKNGRTLTLSDVSWSVQGSGLAGDALVPTSYSATATYTASASSKVADGFITTATYTGEVRASGTAAIVYTVTFLGEPEIVEVKTTEEEAANSFTLPYILIIAAILAAMLIFGALFLRERKRYRKIQKDYYFNDWFDPDEYDDAARAEVVE